MRVLIAAMLAALTMGAIPVQQVGAHDLLTNGTLVRQSGTVPAQVPLAPGEIRITFPDSRVLVNIQQRIPDQAACAQVGYVFDRSMTHYESLADRSVYFTEVEQDKLAGMFLSYEEVCMRAGFSTTAEVFASHSARFKTYRVRAVEGLKPIVLVANP